MSLVRGLDFEVDCQESMGLVRLKIGNLGDKPNKLYGPLVQLGERIPCKDEVVGSIPTWSTIWVDSSAGSSRGLKIRVSLVRFRLDPPEQRKGNVRFGRCMVHIICLKHTNEGMVQFQWCSGARFSGVLADEATASLGRNRALR